MASLLESLGQSLTPQAVGTIGSALGLDPQMVQQGVNVVGPLVQGGLATSASTPQGLDSLMQMLAPPQGAAGSGAGGFGDLLDTLGGSGGSTGMLGGLLSAATGQGAGGSGDMMSTLLNGLFGSGALAAIGPTLDKALGFKVSPLIPFVAPLLLSQLRKLTQEQKLDANGVATLLQQEQQRFLAQGGETTTLVKAAMQAGQEAVALKNKFTPEEWMQVRLAPMAAASVVMSASRSGAGGAVQELTAGMKALTDSHSQAAATSLLNVAFDAPFSDAEKELVSAKAPKEKLMATLKEAASLVASKSPTEAAAYRQLVVTVATKVAEAAKEGGFLGFGGKQVSDAEKAALAEISAVMGA
jgi:hypothetical protein